MTAKRVRKGYPCIAFPLVHAPSRAESSQHCVTTPAMHRSRTRRVPGARSRCTLQKPIQATCPTKDSQTAIAKAHATASGQWRAPNRISRKAAIDAAHQRLQPNRRKVLHARLSISRICSGAGFGGAVGGGRMLASREPRRPGAAGWLSRLETQRWWLRHGEAVCCETLRCLPRQCL